MSTAQTARLGRSKNGASKLRASRQRLPSGISSDAAKFVIAAQIDLYFLDERWKIGMLEAKSTPPTLPVLASREGGYVEQIEKAKRRMDASEFLHLRLSRTYPRLRDAGESSEHGGMASFHFAEAAYISAELGRSGALSSERRLAGCLVAEFDRCRTAKTGGDLA